MSTAELASWLRRRDARTFPYDAVVREYHSAGKHFVPQELLDVLAHVRSLLPDMKSPWPTVQLLASFLDIALDKPDDRYDYRSYLALPLLELPGIDDPVAQVPFARSRCDRTSAQLMADVLGFELAALDGRTTLLSRMRPNPEVTTKRLRLGVRAIRPALARLALDSGLTARDPVDIARQVCAEVEADMSVHERRVMSLTVLPVDTIHDEYLFLRVLQLFETTFSLLVTQLRGTLDALERRDLNRAVHFLTVAETALRDAAPLFSMLATMQVEAFRTFRTFTDGASAIQSRSYKVFESICRQPDPARVDSPAFYSVPEVRARVLAGQHTLDDAYREVSASGELTDEQLGALEQAMRGFAGVWLRWRQTHYRLASRMLTDARGTGSTDGTAYLASVRTIPVFRSVDVSEGDGEDVDEKAVPA
jgi:tryptophan 2,3-dioxygenase